MKVLIVNKFLYPNGGSETYIFELGKILKEKGHEVQYFGMEHEGNIVGNNVNSYTSNMDFHNGNKLSKLFYPFKTINSKEARKKIRLVLDDFEPDVVHLNNFTYQITPSVILEIVKWKKKHKKNVRIVFTTHDSNLICPNHLLMNPNTKELCKKCCGGKYINCYKGRCIHGSRLKSLIGTWEGYYWKRRKTYRYIDTLICCSSFMKDIYDTNPLFLDKTVVLHNFTDKIERKETKKKDYVIFFGRYSFEKGIDTLLEACKALPDIKFVFAGSGPLEDKVNEVSNITNVGFKNKKELEPLIREAKFSICPSNVYENCPFSVIESQMYGTPVIGSNIGGIPELISNGVTGELFEAGNVNELKERIESLYSNENKLKTYSKNCLNVNFDGIEDYYHKLIKIYKGE